MKRISKFQKTILVRGSKWKVRIKENLRDTDGTPCLGLCDSEKKLILIEKNLPKNIFIEVLLHEYLHSVWFETGMDDTEQNDILEHILINPIAKDMVNNLTFFSLLFR